MSLLKKRALFVCFAAIFLLLIGLQSFVFAQFPLPEMDPSGHPAPERGCLAGGLCHQGIEPIRAHDSSMAKQIYKKGAEMGDPNGCVVCHGGNPKEEKDKALAHQGVPEGSLLKAFNRHAGSMSVSDKTCGMCHEKWVYASHRSIMNTEAGKIQGALWGWGPVSTGYDAKYGNYTIDDPDGDMPIFGTEEYKSYTRALMEKYPGNFPKSLEMLPEADVDSIESNPEQAAFTYIRSQCQRCHLGVRGRDKRGDMRGMGCAACHIPYSNEGLYEGGDKSIKPDEKGHVLVHSMQSSRKTKVVANGKVYSGIPQETCASCHNRGKRIGVSYQGLMEFPYGTPYTDKGSKVPKLHTKSYLYIKDDVHHNLESRDGNPKGGLLCQDCHATTSSHGNGNITGTLLANVEIECSDCHGTASKYPWELPLGWGDEFKNTPEMSSPRGIADQALEEHSAYNTSYPKEDGYLITARGNPFGNVTRSGDKVTVHSASGLDFEVPTLKSIRLKNSWKNPDDAIAAKVMAKKHLDKMECYGCHSAWAPQCYGCHVKVDYSGGKSDTDWVASGNQKYDDGHTAESKRDGNQIKLKGKASESRGYLRWENPVLGINGEGRVSPIIPGCQQITTVIGPDGKTLIQNKIWRTAGGVENGGEKGQRGIDMSPAAPHTTSRQPRPCASCHASSKALGYGTHDGRYLKAFAKGVYVDVATAKGELVSRNAQYQIPPIPELPMDYDQVVTRDDEQLQTVGHHWPDSGPLTRAMRDNMERAGVCISCHKDIPGGSFAYRTLSTVGDWLGLIPVNDDDHKKLIGRAMMLTASMEVFGPIFLIMFLVGAFIYRAKFRKKE